MEMETQSGTNVLGETPGVLFKTLLERDLHPPVRIPAPSESSFCQSSVLAPSSLWVPLLPLPPPCNLVSSLLQGKGEFPGQCCAVAERCKFPL